MSEFYGKHMPVKADRTVELLVHRADGVYGDMTAGGGGFVRRILDLLDENGKVVAIDRDGDAIDEIKALFSNDRRVIIYREDFRYACQMVTVAQHSPFAGFLYDFGVSSHMFDQAERGFSHRMDGPLDMRMDQRQQVSAKTVLNEYDERKLSDVFRKYGEEPRARRIAQEIIRQRPLSEMKELVSLIRRVVPLKDESKSVRRVLQAIRIEVNDELRAIEESLPSALELLETGGRMVFLSYHSLEDRIVKQFIVKNSKDCVCDGLPVCVCGGNRARLRPLVKGAEKADELEVKENPRAHSVRLRAVEKIR